MKAGKAPGMDGVLSTILREAAGAVGCSSLKPGNWTVRALTVMFNYVFKEEVWPERWQRGIISPLHKQDSRLEPGNYRPITLLSVVGKVFGSVIERRLSDWSEENRVIADEQGGFRRRRGTPDLIFILRETILMRRAQNLPTLATFVDARKAYDTVWREGNYVKLYNMGVRGKMWRQLQAMSSDPQSKVRLPFGETEWFRVARGVAQGAVESPWLYSCFVNGLADALKRRGLGLQIGGVLTPLLMYADDVVLLASTVSELREMNKVASEYARLNRFTHNGKKSAVMVFNANAALRRRVAEEEWTLSGAKVEVKKQYKYLGVEMLENASWGAYIEKIIKKAQWRSNDLAWILQREKGMRARSACTLWRAMVRPVMEYVAELWGGDLTKTQIRRMEQIQTDFCRQILGLQGIKRVSNDFLRSELGMERLQARWAKLRLGYWRRIQVASPDRLLPHLAGIRRDQLAAGGRFSQKSWMAGTKAMLEKYNLERYWTNPSLVQGKGWKEWKMIVEEGVEDREDVERRDRSLASVSATSERYNQIKHWGRVSEDAAVFSGEVGRRGARVIERYLDDRNADEGRRLKLWCRAGCLPVLETVGIGLRWPDSLQLCTLCNGGETDSISHFLAVCPYFEKRRKALKDKIFSILTKQSNTKAVWFATLPDAGVCRVLLGETVGDARIDDYIDCLTKRYIVKIWGDRKWLNRSVQEVVGWEWLKRV